MNVISAQAIGAAARFDPQIRVPARPRPRRGLVIDFEDDQVVVTGGPKKQLLRGRSATEVLPRLFELLDGERDHAALAIGLGLPEESVFKVLSLLWTCGVIEEAAPEGPAPEIDDGLADFLSRMGDSTGANSAWELAARRLAAARVEVFGDPERAEALVAELGPSMPAVRAAGAVPDHRTTLAVWIDDGRPGPERECWEREIPLVRMRVRGRSAMLGPFVDPRVTPCLACGTAGEEQDGREPVDGDLALAVSLLARDVFALVSRAVPGPLPMRRRVVDLATLEQHDLSAATRPGCPSCSAAPADQAEEAPLAARYEASIAFPPKEHADLKAHQMHYKPSNLALQRIARTWPVARRVELPPPGHELLARPSSGKLDAERLSLLLSVTAGIKADTPQRLFRWTASGGNIGSVVAYVAVRDVPGLDPGLYGYAPAEHRLAWLSPEPPDGNTPATLVLTGDFTKVARKYGAFALRIVLLDSGCAQATCRLAARTLGIGFALRPHWDDDALAALLGVDPDVEPLTAVIDLGGHR
ncbi:nitroreductase family protein [Nonomuraea sediminis]|uniref:nitroreductase family protein n=1 Tax=Nonomuraea sediminis TaxID=2835864 RepID=UPI001BDD6B36|nr:nitroreductase family protein [Nonomuraea sediminis]